MLSLLRWAFCLLLLFSVFFYAGFSWAWGESPGDSIDRLLITQGGLLDGLNGAGGNNNNNQNGNQGDNNADNNPPNNSQGNGGGFLDQLDNTTGPQNNNQGNNSEGNPDSQASGNEAGQQPALPEIRWTQTPERAPTATASSSQVSSSGSSRLDLTGKWRGRQDDAEYGVLHGGRLFQIRRPVQGKTQVYTGIFSPDGFDVKMKAGREDFAPGSLPDQVIGNLIRDGYELTGRVEPATDGKTMRFTMFVDAFRYHPQTFQVVEIIPRQGGQTVVDLTFQGQSRKTLENVRLDLRAWKTSREQALQGMRNRHRELAGLFENPDSGAYRVRTQLEAELQTISREGLAKQQRLSEVTDLLNQYKRMNLPRTDSRVAPLLTEWRQLNTDLSALRLQRDTKRRELERLGAGSPGTNVELQAHHRFLGRIIPEHEKELQNPPAVQIVYVFSGNRNSGSEEQIARAEFTRNEARGTFPLIDKEIPKDVQNLNVGIFFYESGFYRNNGEFPVDALKITAGGAEMRYLGSTRGYRQAEGSPRFYEPRRNLQNWNIFTVPVSQIATNADGKFDIAVEYVPDREKLPGVQSMLDIILNDYRPQRR